MNSHTIKVRAKIIQVNIPNTSVLPPICEFQKYYIWYESPTVMSNQKITPNIPAIKIMNPILRILLIFAWNPLIPANNPVKENRVQ